MSFDEGAPGERLGVETSSSSQGSPGRKKLPWSRPRILFREPLEALAAVCQPAPPAKASIATCPRGPISS